MAIGDFLSGAFGAASEELDTRRKHALELKMLSTKAEIEIAQKKQEFDYQKRLTPNIATHLETQFGMAPGGLSQDVGGVSMGAPTEQANLLSGLQKSKISAQARKESYGRNIRVRTELIGNDVITTRYDSDGNILSEKKRGVAPASQRDFARIKTEWAPSEKILDTLRNSVDVLSAKGSVLESFPTGIQTRLSVLVQNNVHEAVALTKASRAFSLWLTAAVSGKQMTAREQESMSALLPTPEDTFERATDKLDLLSEMINAKIEAAHESYGIAKDKPKKSLDDIAKEVLGKK